MSAVVADIVGANLEGLRIASRFLESLRTGASHPDALGLALADFDGKPDVRRGFARAIQKALER